jgi:hypothetical protein
MRGKHQTDDQPRNAVKRIRPAIERVHNQERLMMSIFPVKPTVAASLCEVRMLL